MAKEGMRVITSDEVMEHQTEKSCWLVRKGRVYDVTKFLPNHPGGARVILDYSGNDVTLLMKAAESHTHSKSAYNMLAELQIGFLEGHEGDTDENTEYVEPVDWSKPLYDQVGALGEKYVPWMHNPVDRKPRLFKSEIMEMLGKSPWFLVPIIWAPVALYHLFLNFKILQTHPSIYLFSQKIAFGPWISPLFLVGGFLTWQITEYCLHRFAWHREPSGKSPTLIVIHFTAHGLHHKMPFDHYHTTVPPVPAVILGWLFFCLFSWLLPYHTVNGWFSGFAIGYMTYDLMHYYLHVGHPNPDSYLGRLKKWHTKHHYIDYDHGFGVTTNLLDFPFGTEFKDTKCD